MRYVLSLIVVIFLLSSCSNYKRKYPYSISDFKPEFRKHLENTVNLGIRGSDYSKDNVPYAEEFNKNCSITDLRKLLQCEHPLLRAMAFRMLIDKDSNNIENILLSSLDDTAIISVDHGEWGIPTMYCADYYLSKALEDGKINRKRILDTLVKKYPNLQNTYIQLRAADSLPEKYYPHIKQMAIATVLKYSSRGNGTPYITYEDEILDDMIFTLSKYKKKEDVSLIKDHLSYHQRFCWGIIQSNPDTTYYTVLNNYLAQLINAKKNGNEFLQGAFLGRHMLAEDFEDFLVTLAKYKDKKSTQIFLTILKDRIYPNVIYFRPDQFECLLYDVLKPAECGDYESLVKSLQPHAEKYKSTRKIPSDQSTLNTK